MKKVTKIESVQNAKTVKQKLRIAAYCRVSTGSDAQLESLDVQKSHYNATLHPVMIGSSPVFIMMKASPAPKQRSDRSCSVSLQTVKQRR